MLHWIQSSVIDCFLRYLHLFHYIQRSQQVYNGKQAGSVGFNAVEKRKLELRQQQQRQRQLQIRQQWQLRTRQHQQQKLRQQVHGENIQRKRPQRQTNDSPVIDQKQNALQKTLWRYSTYHAPKNLQSRGEVESQTASPTPAAFSYYRKIPQVSYESYYSPQEALQKYEDSNFPMLGNLKQRQSNPDTTVISSKGNGLIIGLTNSSQSRSQVMEGSKMQANETQETSLISVSKASTPIMQRPNDRKVLLNYDQSINKLQYKLDSQPKQNTSSTHDAAFVSYHPTRMITSSSVEMGPSNRTGAILLKPNTPLFRNSVSNNLQVGNQLNVSFKSETPPVVLTKTAETQEKQNLVNSSSYALEKQQESHPRLISNTTSNSSEGHVNMGGRQNIQSQEKPTRKEKLFYFPIKRDTLIQMLLLNLEEKYRLLRDTRNVTTSTQYELQNITKVIGPSENISNIAKTTQQIRQPIERTTTFNSSRNSSSSYGKGSNETRDTSSIFIL